MMLHYSKAFVRIHPVDMMNVVVNLSLNLFSVNIHVHLKPSSAIFREGIRLGLVYSVRVSFR